MPRVGEQRIHGSTFGGGVKPVHAVECGEVGLKGLDRRTKCAKVLRRGVDGRLIGGD
jgi:hypothetical protein